MKTFFIGLLGLGLAGCQSGGANHIPPPWQYPGAAIGSVIENTAYKARRRKVERFTADNYEAVVTDIQSGGGATLTHVLGISRVPLSRHPELRVAIMDDPNIYFSGPRPQNIERLVVAIMVHGN